MKLLTMECIYDPADHIGNDDECQAGGFEGKEEYFIKLETKAEWRVLENYVSYGVDLSALNSMIRTTGNNVNVMGDDDIYFYFDPDQKEPAVGEQYTDADDLVWERVA